MNQAYLQKFTGSFRAMGEIEDNSLVLEASPLLAAIKNSFQVDRREDTEDRSTQNGNLVTKSLLCTLKKILTIRTSEPGKICVN